MDELDGSAADTEEYEKRAPAILNALTAELRVMTGERGHWLPLESLEDMLPGMDMGYALGAMAYGLAAGLLVDENAAAAAFFQQRYEELRHMYMLRRPAKAEEIEDIYGGISHSGFSRW